MCQDGSLDIHEQRQVAIDRLSQLSGPEILALATREAAIKATEFCSLKDHAGNIRLATGHYMLLDEIEVARARVDAHLAPPRGTRGLRRPIGAE